MTATTSAVHDESADAQAFCLAWPAARLPEALATVATRSGLAPAGMKPLPLPPGGTSGRDLDALQGWFRRAGAEGGLDLSLVSSSYVDVDALAAGCAPALIRLRAADRDEYRFLALVRGDAGGLVVVTEDLEERRLPVSALRSARFAGFEAEVDRTLDDVLGELGARLRGSESQAVRLRSQFNRGATLTNCWLVRQSPGGSLLAALRREGLLRKVGALFGVQVGMSLAAITAWALLGAGALGGWMDLGWLVAWGLLILTQVPLLVQGEYLQSVLGLELGKHFKQRLLWGSNHMSPDAIRQEGSGALVARVFEAEAVEALALDTGFQLLAVVSNLLLCPFVLLSGVGGWTHLALFGASVVGVLLLGWRQLAARGAWTDARLSLTADLIERMTGHRTRLAQQRRDRWHDGEDELLGAYGSRSERMDRLRTLLTFAPRIWILAAMAALAPAVVDGAPTPALATGIGGVLLGWTTLQNLSLGLLGLSGAAIAWRRVGDLFRAGAHRSIHASPADGGRVLAASPPPAVPGELVLDASDLGFRFPGRSAAALSGAALQLRAGERLLIEGPSGGGKSTFASLLCGLRTSDTGLLLLRGLDRATWSGPGFRERVALVPQFHENHIFSGSLAFNLLMARRWPAQPGDHAAAEQVCRELGLGPLLERMPRGLDETVGDSGWQLSHGERSRVCIARALLQEPDVLVLDESLGALDPETLDTVMGTVKARARTLVVIAHA